MRLGIVKYIKNSHQLPSLFDRDVSTVVVLEYYTEILLSMQLLISISITLKGTTGSPGKRGKPGQKVIFQFTLLICIFLFRFRILKK